MRPFSRSAKQASLFCSRLIKWLFLKCLSYIVCKDTICLRVAETTYTERLRVGELCSGMVAPCYTNVHTAAATERLRVSEPLAREWPTALRSRCARRSLDLRSSLLTLDRGQASLALFSLKRSLAAASRQHGCENKFTK